MTTARTSRQALRTTLFVAVVVAADPRQSHAQARTDTLYLDQLQRAAEQVDRRGAQTGLLARQSALRLQGIRDERLPTLGTIGTAQYLSDVVSVGAILPGVRIPSPAHDQYDAYITARQPLLDFTRASRVATENAQARELAARVHTATWQQRALVSDAFFGVLLRDAQLRSIDAAIAELDARARVAADRVKAGAALPSEELLLQAERGRRVQQRDELRGDRNGSREMLARLIGQVLPDDLVLAVREVPGADAFTGAVADTLRARPEFAQFDRARDVVASRRALAAAQDRPRVSAFSRAGYGRPGLNALGRSFDTYWVAGVQVEWAPWNWGRTKRDPVGAEGVGQLGRRPRPVLAEQVGQPGGHLVPAGVVGGRPGLAGVEGRHPPGVEPVDHGAGGLRVTPEVPGDPGRGPPGVGQ